MESTKKDKKIMVTGGLGFIGTNLIHDLQEDPKNEIKVYTSNLTKKILLENDFDVIYHLAANTDTRFPDDVEMYKNNILGFLNVLDFARKGKSKLIYASSASMYGDYQRTAYAKSKILIDEIAEHFFDKLPIVGLRFFNCYGSFEQDKGKMASMISQWRDQILAGKRPIIFDGEYRRDFIYVKDVIKALKQVRKLKSGIYDVGTGKATDFREVLKIVIETLEIKVKPKLIKNPYLGHYQTYTKADISWGFKPDYSLKEGIKDYF